MGQNITDAAEAREVLSRLFAGHRRAVFFGGAGVSTAAAWTGCITKRLPIRPR